jgi:predicted Holliday junction resolvase-like endonuclease
MPTYLLSLLGSPKALFIILIVLGLGAATIKYKMMENKIESQIVEINNVTERALAAELKTESFVRASEEAALRDKETEKLTDEVDKIEEEVNASTPEEDGAVAPVLRGVLDAIDGLRS